jgi:hypothetical protein
MEAEVIEMAFYTFIQCRWCGFTGCAAPFGEECPSCRRLPEPEPTPQHEDAEPVHH